MVEPELEFVEEPCVTYATQVVKGDIPAGEPLLLDQQRFLREWRNPPPWIEWDRKRADAIERLARKLSVYSALAGKRVPFEPLPWQLSFLRRWNGWRIRDRDLDPLQRETGTRRLRNLMLYGSKGCGKSPVAVPILISSMLEEPNAQCYCAAGSNVQAQRPWVEFLHMVKHDEQMGGSLAKAFKFRHGHGDSAAEIFVTVDGKYGTFRTVGGGSDSTIQSGPIPNLILAEEYHSARSSRIVNALQDGTKLRKQPTTVFLMNAPENRYGPGYELYLKAISQLKGAAPFDDSALYLIFELPEEELEMALEKVKIDGYERYTERAMRLWIKGNPSLPETVRNDYIIGKLQEATSEARKQEVYRNVLSVIPKRGDIDKLWLDWSKWERCLTDSTPSAVTLRTCPLYLGIDLADNRCFSALVAIFKLPGGTLHVRFHAYTPWDTLEDRSKKAGIDFCEMALQGQIKTCPGGSMDYGLIVDDIERYANTNEYDLRGVAFDRKFMYLVAHEMTERNLPWREPQVRRTSKRGIDGKRVAAELKRGGLLFFNHPQGGGGSGDPNDFSMDRGMTAFEARYEMDVPMIQIERNALANWMVLCATEHQSGALASKRRYISLERTAKDKGRGYNDLLVALAMGVGLADWREIESPSDGASRYARMSKRWDAMAW